MAGSDYWKKRFKGMEDTEFQEVEKAVIERGAESEIAEPNDGIISIDDIADDIKEEFESWGKVRGIRTGYTTLDKKLGGMGEGHVILIGGETSNGKSALATNIAVNVAKTDPVLYITLEMQAKEIGSRIMHIYGENVGDLQMLFQSQFRLTYKDVKPLLKNAMEYAGIKLVVLDYLQYLGRGMKLEEVAIMSKEMKTLALEFNIPFIVIVSLRKAEQGKGKRKWTDIEIEDLMGTGSIGYDADAAIIVSRKDLNNEYDEDNVYVKILKTRNARLDYSDRYVALKWDRTRITEDFVEAINSGKDEGWEEAGQQGSLLPEKSA
jgi:replicative DNA helicase